ncbi:F-box domain-containing protein [Favolaschia claudopus]|uniref:F-box domain-containing protein n=1 Tax=Favolaschia claudopus TaxID=2862362 RepID=A0AAW0CAS3_9AGAR
MSDTENRPALPLPFELISLIFIFCLPLRRRVCPHPHKAPLNLASVCTQWREAALGIPELWTSMFLQVDEPFDGVAELFDSSFDKQHPFVALMNLWFARTSGHPLSISLSCARDNCLPKGLLDVMAVYCGQWGRIELVVPADDFLVFNNITGPFPCLSSLTVKITDDSPSFSDLRIASIQNSPQLRALQLPGHIYKPHAPESLAILPRGLTAARLFCVERPYNTPPATVSSSFSSLFRHLPHLVHLDLYVCRLPVNPPNTRFKTSLLTLHLNLDDALDFLDVPTLQFLHTTLTCSTSFTNFITHSQCRITTLSVEITNSLNQDALAAVFGAVPELRTLVVAVVSSARWSTIKRCEALFDIRLFPQLRNLIIEERATFPAYDRWSDLLELRTGMEYAQLYVHTEPGQLNNPFVLPWREIEARWAVLAAGGMKPHVVMGKYTWPSNAKDEDPVEDLDFGFTIPREIRPYHFSPF